METGEYLLNGESIVTPFDKVLAVGGTLIQYSGSSAVTERINATKPLQKRILVQVMAFEPIVHDSILLKC